MYPERDSRADEFDDAVERRRSGDNTPIEDPELQALVDLASRLDETLPEDTPDPEFRSTLKQQLLEGEPEPDLAPDDVSPPFEETTPWYRRFVASPWRTSAAAAACLLIVVVALMAAANPFDWGSGGGSEEVTSFQPVSFSEGDGPFDGENPLDAGFEDNEEWLSSPFPPLDMEHVVLHPLLIGFRPLAERQRPEVELNGAADMVNPSDMPSSIPVYYLNAPPGGPELLTALGSTLQIDGELAEQDEDGTPYRWVDDDDNVIMRWDPSSAFFQFNGEVLDEPLDGLLEQGATPDEIAQRFLELIGFDFMTIDYEIERIDNGEETEIRFRPEDLPDIGLEVGLGGRVRVDDSGAVLGAQLFWLSLVDIEIVGLREHENIIEDIENDAGYTPPTGDETEVSIDAEEMTLIHVLTRMEDSIFVLQPAVRLTGSFRTEVDSMIPGPARYLVPIVDSDED